MVVGLILLAGLAGCERSSSPVSDEPANAPSRVASDSRPEYQSQDPDRVEGRGAETANWWDALPRPEWEAFERLDDGGGWFEAYAVGPGVIAIYEPGQFEEVISYLILGDTRAMLFDTGLGIGNIRRQVEALTELPVVVLNSHSHYDHIGGNGLFSEIYGPDHPYTAGRMAGVAHEVVADVVAPAWVWKDTPDGFDPEAYHIAAYEITEYVGEGSVIDLGGRSLEVLMTPGHAPDSLCLLDRAGRVLFVGDTFYPAPLYTHIAGSSFDDYANSAKRLVELVPLVDYLYPGHNVGRVSANYLTAMDEAFSAIGSPAAVKNSATAGESAANGLQYVETDGNRQYQFEGFSIITAGAAADESGE